VIAALASLLVVLGSALVLVACLGLVRLPDLYTRMHASTKPATLGVSLIVVALAIHSGELGIAVRALLIVLFFLLTAPVAAHRLGQAAYRSGVARWSGTVRDDLAESVAARVEPEDSAASAPGPGPPDESLTSS
jgi:multicomponent Na+:H+ antiporter subunit G